MSLDKKIIIAAGGTGGHLFPAMGLAEELLRHHPRLSLRFVGAGLSTNRYFDRTRFLYAEVKSATPASRGVLGIMRALKAVFLGLITSFRLLAQEKPHLVVGFGSFHSFPLLCAATLRRIPLVLFESNALPGKVIRLFSKRALFTGIYFPAARPHLKGRSVDVDIPRRQSIQDVTLSRTEAKALLGLEENLPIVLVFGGSQGARAINAAVYDMLQGDFPFQLIHFTGNEESALQIRQICTLRGIRCYVQSFEPRMALVWKVVDMALCRAGALTLSELIEYEVPSVLVPYRFASDDHQMKNALFMQNEVKGGVVLEERYLSGPRVLADLLQLDRVLCSSAIVHFKQTQSKRSFARCVSELLHHEKK